MREIKFRVYDYIGKQMLFPGDKSNIMNRVQYELVFTGKITFQEYEYETGFRKEFSNNHLAVMQFTGLKDKNDKEIYEGDIVRYSRFQAVIKWGEGVLPGFYADDITDDKGFKYFTNANLQENITDIKVVGNIYENPELLK